MVYYKGTTFWWMFVLNYNTNFEILIIKKNIDSSEKRKTVPEIKYYREHHIKKS